MARRFSLEEALRLLLGSYEKGGKLPSDSWQGARAAEELLCAGLSKAQLYLFVQNGYCQCRLSKQGSITKDNSRRGSKYNAITRRSRLILTPAGAMLARQILYPLPNGRKRNPPPKGSRYMFFPDLTLPAVPHFDAADHEVWWGKYLIKRFTRPAPNLEAILTTLEKSNWSEHVPMIVMPNGNRLNKYQIHDAVKTWNESSLGEFIALHGDGMGLGIRWERLK